MRWHAVVCVLLACALSKWLLATDIHIQDPSIAGMPLSDVEYDHFFKTLNGPRRVSAVCFLRAMYGCQNVLIQTLDLYENHGIVPEGRVCSDLEEMPTFPDFCTLTFYRCTLKKYFVKRVQCPDEIDETPATTQNVNQEPGDTESSSTLQETPLISILPTSLPTTETSLARLTSASNTPTAATEAITMIVPATATETIPELPAIISAVTSSVKPLLSTPTTDSESLLELLTSLDAVIAEQSFPELFTTTGTIPTTHVTFLPAVPSLSPVPTLPFTSNAMNDIPVSSVSDVTVSSSEPTTTEVATSSMGSVPTNPATPVAPTSSPTSASPSPIITATASLAISTHQPCSVLPFPSSSTASKMPVLLTKPTTPKNPAHFFPPAGVAPWPVVPISAALGQYPLQPTPVMQLFVLPSGFGPGNLKPQSVIALSPLLPIRAGPDNIWQKKKVPEPQTNPPTTAKLENLFLRLQDSRVQQLMQKMRGLMTKGKSVKKQLLQSTSLQLLSALKHVQQKKSRVSLVSKNQLQR